MKRGSGMKNHQYIRQLKVKDLAPLLIKSRTQQDWDEGLDGEWYCCGELLVYILPDGSETLSYEDAVHYTIDWLNAEHKDKK